MKPFSAQHSDESNVLQFPLSDERRSELEWEDLERHMDALKLEVQRLLPQISEIEVRMTRDE